MDADGSSDATPARSKVFELLFDAAVAFPDTRIDEAESDSVILVRGGRAVCLGDILVHRTGVGTPTAEILLLGRGDEIING